MPNIQTENKKEKMESTSFKIAKVIQGDSFVTIKIPKAEASRIGLDGEKAFYIVTNNVIQIGGAAIVDIPALVLEEDSFLPKQ